MRRRGTWASRRSAVYMYYSIHRVDSSDYDYEWPWSDVDGREILFIGGMTRTCAFSIS